MPKDTQSEDLFQEALDLYAQMITTRIVWFYRIGKPKEAVDGIFPENMSLGTLQK